MKTTTITLNPKDHPVGTRLLVLVSIIENWTILEWSSRGFVKIDSSYGGVWWNTPDDVYEFQLIEVLPPLVTPLVPVHYRCDGLLANDILFDHEWLGDVFMFCHDYLFVRRPMEFGVEIDMPRWDQLINPTPKQFCAISLLPYAGGGR